MAVKRPGRRADRATYQTPIVQVVAPAAVGQATPKEMLEEKW
ncbi:MAG: hypothetical protein JWR66_3554 [Modestobacter sp.]|nr:hypothetical protein [Modestobacter sp.]